MVTYEEFRKIELKIGTIKDVQLHPQADRLYILTVDIGDGGIRQLVAGIRPSYEQQALVGRQVVVVVNLEPAVIRGVESQGMVLAGSDAQGISVVSPDRHLSEGSIVK